MNVTFTLNIKFRAFGITYGQTTFKVAEPVPAELSLIPGVVDLLNRVASKLKYDNHGVKLTVTVG